MTFTLVDAAGNEVGKVQGDEKRVRYAVYGAEAGQYKVDTPEDLIVTGKAIQDYEHYLCGVGK